MTKKIILTLICMLILLFSVGAYCFWEFKQQQQTKFYNLTSNNYRAALSKENIANLKLKLNIVNNIYENKINLILSGIIIKNQYGGLSTAMPFRPKMDVLSNNRFTSIKIQELDCQLKDNQIIIKARGIPNDPKAESEFMIGCEVKNLAKGKYQVKYGEQGEVLDSFEILDNPK
jgi:hypothetical protein